MFLPRERWGLRSIALCGVVFRVGQGLFENYWSLFPALPRCVSVLKVLGTEAVLLLKVCLLLLVTDSSPYPRKVLNEAKKEKWQLVTFLKSFQIFPKNLGEKVDKLSTGELLTVKASCR